jgi:hypothetical protein
MANGPFEKKVDGSFLANRGPYGFSDLEVTKPGYPVAGIREIIYLGTDTAVMPDGSTAEGELYRTTHEHSLIFKPISHRRK